MSKGSLGYRGWEPTYGMHNRTRSIDEATAQAILDQRDSGRTKSEVAKEFGVSFDIVRNIWIRRSWKHLRAKALEA